MDALLGVCAFMVNLAIFVFNADIEKMVVFKAMFYGEFYFRMKVLEKVV